MPKHEYKVTELKPKSVWNQEIEANLIEQHINEMSSEGWELVNAIPKTFGGSLSGITFIFKREATF